MAKKILKPVILSVETSGRAGSVAAGRGDELLAEKTFCGLMRHSIELFPAIKAVLAQIGSSISDVTEIYVSAGPGSFTGLRIGITMAKMTAFATGARIIAVNTLEAIAQNAGLYIEQSGEKIGKIATILDAKRKEFYVAVFERLDVRWVKTDGDGLMRAEEFLARFAGGIEPVWLLGEGLVYYKRAFTGQGIRFLDEDYWPSRAGGVYTVGRRMAKAGIFAEPATLEPQYLRQAQAQEKWKMREVDGPGNA